VFSFLTVQFTQPGLLPLLERQNKTFLPVAKMHSFAVTGPGRGLPPGNCLWGIL